MICLHLRCELLAVMPVVSIAEQAVLLWIEHKHRVLLLVQLAPPDRIIRLAKLVEQMKHHRLCHCADEHQERREYATQDLHRAFSADL